MPENQFTEEEIKILLSNASKTRQIIISFVTKS